MQSRLGELASELRRLGLEPDLVEEDGGLLSSCGETVVHVQVHGSPEAPYVRARNLILADVEGGPEVHLRLARENLASTAGAFVHEPAGGVVRLGGVFPDTPEYRPSIPSILWALATTGERLYEELATALGGYTWAEAGREDHDLGAPPVDEPLRVRRPPAGVARSLAEARRGLDRLIESLGLDGESVRLGEGHHMLSSGAATHEVSLSPRPFRTTIRVLTRILGDLDPEPELVAQLNDWNESLGFAAFAYHERERALVCSSILPGTFLGEGLAAVLGLHASLAAQAMA